MRKWGKCYKYFLEAFYPERPFDIQRKEQVEKGWKEKEKEKQNSFQSKRQERHLKKTETRILPRISYFSS